MSKKIILCLDGTDNQYKTDYNEPQKLDQKNKIFYIKRIE